MDLNDSLDAIADQLESTTETNFYGNIDLAKEWLSEDEDFHWGEDSPATAPLEEVLRNRDVAGCAYEYQTTVSRSENGRMWENTCKQVEYLAVRNAKLASEYATLEMRLHSAQADLSTSHQLLQQLISELHIKSMESASLSTQVECLQGELEQLQGEWKQLHGKSAYWTEVGECVVCMCNMRAVVLMPCLHLCVCEQCSEEIRLCPLCRQPVMSCLKPYA